MENNQGFHRNKKDEIGLIKSTKKIIERVKNEDHNKAETKVDRPPKA